MASKNKVKKYWIEKTSKKKILARKKHVKKETSWSNTMTRIMLDINRKRGVPTNGKNEVVAMKIKSIA